MITHAFMQIPQTNHTFFDKCWHIVETGYCHFGEIFVAGCPEIYQNVVCPDGLSSPGARTSASRLMSVIIPFIYGRALEGRERVCIHEFHPAQYSCCFYHILLFRDYVFGIPPPVRDIIVNHNPIASIKGAAMTFGLYVLTNCENRMKQTAKHKIQIFPFYWSLPLVIRYANSGRVAGIYT